MASIPPAEIGSTDVPEPAQGRKFHCLKTQAPGGSRGTEMLPGSLGMLSAVTAAFAEAVAPGAGPALGATATDAVAM